MSDASLSQAVAALRAQTVGRRAEVESLPDASQRTVALEALAALRDRIRTAIGTVGPADLISGLDAQVPLALLPARIETRFGDPGTDVLHVRIFPDDVHVDAHDPALTAAEAALGAALWAAPADLLAAGETPPSETPAPGRSDGRRALFGALVRRLGGPRAAWAARATKPGAPPAQTKDTAYVRPPVARALPDRWLVRAYRGTTVLSEAWTLPLGVDLQLAPDPQNTGGQPADASLPNVDPELRWLVDYAAALSAGMAVDVPLPAGTDAIDRVIAVGVRASAAPADAASELRALLEAHRYTDGLGVLAQGTPTSNSPAARSSYVRTVNPDELWAQEFGLAPAAGSAGPSLVGALGLDAGVLDGIGGSGDAGDAHARAMQTALWAATWGYYLGALVDPAALGGITVDAIREHYLGFVRGRGTLPVLRIGRQPYGILPILSLDRWTADGASPAVGGLARLLQRARPLWQYGVAAPVTASEGPDFDAAFTRAMSTDGVARAYAIRSAIGDRSFDPGYFSGVDASATGVLDALVGNVIGGRNPLVIDLFSPTAQPVRAPLVVSPTDPMPDATVQAAIAGLTRASPLRVLGDSVFFRPTVAGPATVLHTLLRRSLLLEYANAGLAVSPPSATTAVAAATALSGLQPAAGGGFTPVVTLPKVLSSATIGGVALGDWLFANPDEHPDKRRTLDETLAAFGVLVSLGADELELLLRETLDLASHRWTAWAESVAADKLARLRQAAPAGIALGGWGMVERLTRRTRTSVDLSLAEGAAPEYLWADTSPGGFVHAPSTAQAATAAVLRAAHLAHGGDDDTTCAVDLSSGPARTAVRLAAGIRAGQELGALLGYELERDLHARKADGLIAPLRRYAPRWRAMGTFVEGDAEEIVSPSAVVDGLAVADADPAAVAAAVLPAGAAADLTSALAGALATLGSYRHALADLLTAEAVHQTLLGNSSRAGAALDAAGRGGVPPEDFDVLRTPRSGSSLTCRVGVLLPSAAPGPLPQGWPKSPRSAADPQCAGWLAAVLPAPARVRLRIQSADGSTTEATLPDGAGLGPLDVVLDLPELVRTRVRLAIPDAVVVVPGRDPAWSPDTVSLDELLTVAAGLREVLAARPLRRTDLLAPGAPAGDTDERDADDLRTRVDGARSSVVAAAAAVAAAATGDTAAIASALSVGVVLHVPEQPSAADLQTALDGAAAELAGRLASPAPAADASVDDLVAALQGLFGAAQPAVPALVLDAATATAAAAGLAAGDAFLGTAPDLAADWLDDLAAVRQPAAGFAAALQGCEALAGPAALAGSLRIVEPTGPGAAWTATLDADALAQRAPVATIVAWAGDGLELQAAGRLSGLLVDEWVEIVPERIAATSVAYQAEAPVARAPQAILLGLVPDRTAGWNVDAVVDLVLEAADLAAIRTVDAETGAWFGRVLPAVLLPDGDATDVIAAPALPLLQVDAALLEAERLQVKELG
jgi:hypothetical protein